MSHHKKIYVNPSHIKKLFANMRREGKDFSRRVTPLFETIMVQANQEEDDSVPTPSNDPPLSSEDSMQLSELMLLCTNLQKQVLDLEKAKDAQAKEIANLKKMGRSIEDIDKDADVSLFDDTQGRSDDAEMFDTNDLHSEEVDVDMPIEDDKETDEHEKVEVDNEAELKKHLLIVKNDDIAIDVVLLATKPLVIVEYKINKEGIIGHYQLIRADGSSKRYSSMIRMLQDIDREDLQTL
ncbi:hypothetical protein Tco_1517932 [Tanacetum coccineum]